VSVAFAGAPPPARGAGADLWYSAGVPLAQAAGAKRTRKSAGIVLKMILITDENNA
jgi:hypothetical protein